MTSKRTSRTQTKLKPSHAPGMSDSPKQAELTGEELAERTERRQDLLDSLRGRR